MRDDLDLLGVKASLPRGKFGAWVKAHCSFDRTQSWRYMKCCAAQHLPDAPTTIREAAKRGARPARQGRAAP